MSSVLNNTPKPIISAQQLKFKPTDCDPCSLMTRIFDVRTYRDRFAILNDLQPFNYSNYKWERVQPSNNILIFSELADRRACEIIDRYPTGNVVISWSGGVDSTCVLVSFLRNLEDKSRLKVVCAESSLEEYPWMYRHLTNDLHIDVFVTNHIFRTIGEMPDVAIQLNGFCGDQMYGANIHQYYPHLYSKNWIDAAKFILDDKQIKYTQSQFDQFINAFQYYSVQLDYLCTQWCEMCWLFSFGFKWEYYSLEHKLRLYALGYKENAIKAIAFYNTPYFEQLSIQNSKKVTEYNPFAQKRYYKFPMKQYIFEYTDDLKYYLNKGKFGGRICVNEDLWPIAVQLEDDSIEAHEVTVSEQGYYKWHQSVADQYRRTR